MVGYALGNRTGEEEDMDIILEDHPSSVRFSLALQINLFSGKTPIKSSRIKKYMRNFL